jgi:heme A synthase
MLLVASLVVSVFRNLPRGHLARRTAAGAGFVIVVEALLGAALVLFGLVADNDTVTRAVVIAIHLTNTLVLLAMLALTAWLAPRPSVHLVSAGWIGKGLMVGLAALVLVGATGAVTALGDTLFPAGALREAIKADMSPTAHILVRMRVLHPAMALVAGVFLLMLAGSVGVAVPRARRASSFVTVAVIFQIALGFVNLFLLAPIPLQVMHLLAADLLWIGVIVLSASVWLVMPEASPEHVAGPARSVSVSQEVCA